MTTAAVAATTATRLEGIDSTFKVLYREVFNFVFEEISRDLLI